MRTLIILALLLAPVIARAQSKDATNESEKAKVPESVPTASGDAAALETARKSFAAHGGVALKNMKTLIVRGSAQVSGSPTQTIDAAFVTIFSGEKYRLEIDNPMRPLKQISNGESTVSNIPNFQLPPINRLGLPMLQRIEEKGFVVTALPASAKKKTGFRITSPEGYFTDFLVDDKSFEIKSYEATYSYEGRTVTTAVEIDKYRDVDNVKIPEKYSQRFDLGFLTIYSSFKAKEILVNTEVADDVFRLDK